MNEFEPKSGSLPGTDWQPSEPPCNVWQERRRPASIAFAVSFITLFTSLIQVVIMALISRFAPALADRDWYVIVLSTLPMYVIAMPLSLLFYRIGRAEPPMEKRRLSPLVLCGLLAVCFALTYAGNIIGLIVNAILSLITGEPIVNELQELTMNTPLWANLLFCGILAPILEEIFYRKLVIDRLRRYGDLAAILFSGVLFGLIHGNFSQFFYAALIGILFGYIYLHTGKLRYTVALHMGVNLIGGVYSTEMLKRMDMMAFSANPFAYIAENAVPVAMFLLYMIFIMICFVVAPVTIALVWKHIRLRKGEVELTFGLFVKIFLLNPAVWLLLGVIVLLFVM